MNPKSLRPASVAAFQRALITWYGRRKRDLPWRRTADPYHIWIAEVMLQQTRVEAARPYYDRFVARFPDVAALAVAPEADVLACWSGLGYYSRARNLQKAAVRLASAGAFPRDYDAIRALPGVGDYTAAAVASIAFGLPHAVLDGNVARVVARLTDERGDIGSAATRARLRATAGDLLDRKSPGLFNQAMMELGALVCLPGAPQCRLCPVARFCGARGRGAERELPVKARRAAFEQVLKSVLVIRDQGRVLLGRTPRGSRLMEGFWELPEAGQVPGARIGESLGVLRHTITHHRYTVSVFRAEAPDPPDGFEWLLVDELDRLPLSTIARKALRKSG